MASFRIEAVPSPDKPIAIVMDVTGGDAYGVADGQRDVFILPGDTSSILVLATDDDSIDELQGSISATIRQQPLYTVGARSTAQVIVSDNDLASSQPVLEGTPESQRSAAEPTPEVPGESDGGSAPSFGEAVVSDMAFIAGQDVGLVQLPGATGGQGLLSYELTPALPDGLQFDDGALTISGVPVGAASRARYTLSVADGEGRRAGLTFLITVLHGPAAVPTPTAAPTPEPTAAASPTTVPTDEPTAAPSPTAAPTPEPTTAPSPTAAPTLSQRRQQPGCRTIHRQHRRRRPRPLTPPRQRLSYRSPGLLRRCRVRLGRKANRSRLNLRFQPPRRRNHRHSRCSPRLFLRRQWKLKSRCPSLLGRP